MAEEKAISFIEEVVKEVLEENKDGFAEGVSFREGMAVYDNLIGHIRETMEEEDCYSINLPYIGVMHLNEHRLRKSIRKRESLLKQGKNIDVERHEENKRKLAHLEDFKKQRQENKEARGRTTHSKLPIHWKINQRTKEYWTFERLEERIKEINE